MNKKELEKKKIVKRLNELADLMKQNGFCNIEYRNLSNGISAIHSGWKI